MPNPPRDPETTASPRKYQHDRRQKELEDQKIAIYDEGNQLENANLVRQAVRRWNVDEKYDAKGPDSKPVQISIREAAKRATLAGLSDSDAKVKALHVRNVLYMEQQEQKDLELQLEKAKGQDQHLHLHSHNAGPITSADQQAILLEAIDRELQSRGVRPDSDGDGIGEHQDAVLDADDAGAEEETSG